MATAVDPTTGVGTPTMAAPAGTAIVTDCTVSGGSYSLSESGAGEAQLQLDCAGAGTEAVTWKLFVVAGDGFSLAQTFRAVQLEPLPGATDGEIVDLTLTLR